MAQVPFITFTTDLWELEHEDKHSKRRRGTESWRGQV